jgi:Ca2+-binding RTX toxin-like protein
MTLSGTSNADLLTGGSGNDTFFGSLGADTINGGLGNDTVIYTSSGAAVVVNLATNVNTGGHAAGDSLTAIENITGSSFADTITGDGNANTLDGGAGADSLTGGTGNDVYGVDDAGDIVVELAGQGTDEIRTTLTSYSIAALANIENLTFVGLGNFTGTGNTSANSITGGTGNDTLNGGTGADTMVGGAGNDVYTVDNASDVVTELAGGGTDEIRTTLTTYSIAALANVENLTFIGAGNFTGTGNTAANSITGGTGNDTLNGGAGADTMVGGSGNDVYTVDNASDVVTELAGGGTDEIRTTLTTYSIAALANVENLTFTGAGNFTGTGNTAANSITGGTGNDTLSGSDGNDTLIGGTGADSLSGGNDNDLIIGGQGADTLTGGAGSDTFRYLAGDATAIDQIIGFTAGVGGDAIDLDLLIPGYDNNPLTLSSYVRLVEAGGNTSLQIDPTGTSSFTTTVLTLQGVTGLDLNSLRTNGNLIT